jgi:hypothetical protein
MSLKVSRADSVVEGRSTTQDAPLEVRSRLNNLPAIGREPWQLRGALTQ